MEYVHCLKVEIEALSPIICVITFLQVILIKQQLVAQSKLEKYGDPRPQIFHRSFRVSSSAGVFLALMIPTCPPDVSSVLPTTLTPQYRHICGCSLIPFLRAVRPSFSPGLPSSRMCFVVSGSILYYCPFLGSKPELEAGLSYNHGDTHCAASQPSSLPLISSSTSKSSMCAPTLLAGNKQNGELHCNISIANLINSGQFYHGFCKILSLGNLEMMTRCISPLFLFLIPHPRYYTHGLTGVSKVLIQIR